MARFDLNFYTIDSLRAVNTVTVELGAQPHTMAIIDGKILISSGTITTVIDVPPEDIQPNKAPSP